jgi:PadR family transcriptional regulator AphA
MVRLLPWYVSGRYVILYLADMSSLSPTARVILGLLRIEPRSGYDIKRVTDFSTRFFWGASYGQIYPELRRLEAAGLVRTRDAPRGGVRRRVHEITADGRRVLDAWLTEPTETFELRDEGLLKLFFGEIVSHDDLVELVRRRRAWFEGVSRHFHGIADQLGEVDDPSGEVLRYGIELMEWNAAWFADLDLRLTRSA